MTFLNCFRCFKEDMPFRFVSSVGSTNELQREMEKMKEVLRHAQSPVVFCHNDLTSGNFIYNKDSGTFWLASDWQ